MERLKLSKIGQELLNFTISHIELILNKFNFLRTQVVYPSGKNQFISIELSKIFDQLIKEFNLKTPFTDKSSQYFAFMKETALKILKIKIESDSPDCYAFCYQTEENKIIIIFKDHATIGISKLTYKIVKKENTNKVEPIKVEKLPSNAYTNPLFGLQF